MFKRFKVFDTIEECYETVIDGGENWYLITQQNKPFKSCNDDEFLKRYMLNPSDNEKFLWKKSRKFGI